MSVLSDKDAIIAELKAKVSTLETELTSAQGKLASAETKVSQFDKAPKALPGMYSQYDKAGKHWYAPNKFEAYGEEEIQAVVDALRDGFLAPGPRTERFEAECAELFDKKQGLMVNSGSSANLIALNAFGFQPGDEVVTAAFTFSTVIAPLVQLARKNLVNHHAVDLVGNSRSSWPRASPTLLSLRRRASAAPCLLTSSPSTALSTPLSL